MVRVANLPTVFQLIVASGAVLFLIELRLSYPCEL